MVDTDALDEGKAAVWNGKNPVTGSGIDKASLALLALDHLSMFVASTIPHSIAKCKGSRPSEPRQMMDSGHRFHKNNAFDR
jgi:hypothetical protein